MADFYSHSGYSVQTNVRLTGRTGTHEIDVLAEKSDGLNTFRVGIECKSWARPIDKDVVAKVAFVFGDLGIGNRLIIAPGGATESARAAANELNVQIWDIATLDAKLRDAGMTPSVSTRASVRIQRGIAPRADAEWHRSRRAMVEAQMGRGERLVVASRLWVPRLVMEWQFGIETGLMRKRRSTRTVVSVFDGIRGEWGNVLAPDLVPYWTTQTVGVVLSDAVMPVGFGADDGVSLVQAIAVEAFTSDASRKQRKVAKDILGIDPLLVKILNSLCTGQSIVYVDTYVALVERGSEYVHAVNSADGSPMNDLAAALSEQTWLLKGLPGFGVPALAPSAAPAPHVPGQRHASPY